MNRVVRRWLDLYGFEGYGGGSSWRSINRVIHPWLDRPWRVLAVVTALCATSLAVRMCLPWDLVALIWYPYRPEFLGYIVVFGLAFGPGAIGLLLAVLTWKRHRTPGAVLPAVVVALSVVLLITVPWDRAYFRTVWLLHRCQYAGVVRGLADGRLTAGANAAVMQRTPAGSRLVVRPTVVRNADSGPSPNLYFPVYCGGLFDSRSFGFLYLPESEAALTRKYWRGKLPDTWTRLKPHWYLVED